MEPLPVAPLPGLALTCGVSFAIVFALSGRPPILVRHRLSLLSVVPASVVGCHDQFPSPVAHPVRFAGFQARSR